MARTKRGRLARQLSMPEMTLTPLIDTVLVLLVVFMMTAPILHNSITIELPTSSTNDDTVSQVDQEPIGVYLDKDRTLYIDDVKVSREKFFDALEKKLSKTKDRVVFVHADKVIPYGDVITIVDDIKYLGGVKYVALATEHA